jgi:molybdenum cofactor cytidylyltransferase
MSPLVIVLASGRGERFAASGGQVHKLQAQLGDKIVLQHTLDAVRASGLPFHLEDQAHPGMGDSIAAAVRATPNADSWLILPADLPLVLPTTLLQVAREPMNRPVLTPVYQGQRGHPVRFARSCGPELMKLAGAQGAARLVKLWGATELELDDAGCVTDIDTLQDLSRAEVLWRARVAAPVPGRESRVP